jgi:hypothetical protein
VSQLRDDSSSSELVVRESPARKNVSTEAEDIASSEDIVCPAVIFEM